MIIKSFTADTAAAALKKVREEMGRDAIVLRTRQLQEDNRRKGIEITACIDRPTVARATSIMSDTKSIKPSQSKRGNGKSFTKHTPNRAGTENSYSQSANVNLGSRIDEIDRKLDWLLQLELQSHSDQERFGALKDVYWHLKEADLPDLFLNQFMTALVEEYGQRHDTVTFARKKLVEHLSSLMLPGLSFKPGDRLLFLGPAGAGKSSVMGKLAARLIVLEKQKVKLSCLDFSKIAAHDELASYAEILGVNVSNPLNDSVSRTGGDNCIMLIDSPALPLDQEKLERLKKKIDQVDVTHNFAVFSALTRSSDVESLATRLEMLEPTYVISTMFDQTHRYGSVVAAAITLGVKVAFVTDSSGGMGQIKVPDPDALARDMLGMEVGLE